MTLTITPAASNPFNQVSETEAFKPKADNQVWKRPDGVSLYEGRTINTADGAGKATMRDIEKMVEAFANNPAWGAKALYEDSANGTPVVFQKTFQLTKDNYEWSDDPDAEPKVTQSRYATVKVDVKCVDGKLTATTRFEMTKKEFAKNDFVNMLSDKGIEKRPAAVLEATAQLTPEGHINDVNMEARLENLPELNTLAIAEYREFIKDVREQAMQGGKQGADDVEYAVSDFVGNLESLLPGILASIAADVDLSDFTISPREDAMELSGYIGDGEFSFNLKNLFAGEELEPDEVALTATVSGSVEDRYDWDSNDPEINYDVAIKDAKLSVDQSVNLVPPSDGAYGDWKATTKDGQPLDQRKAEQLGQILMFAVASFMDM